MTSLLELHPGDCVLEIGTGSGYQAAILSAMEVTVISIERLPEVADIARKNLNNAGISNVTILVSDGSQGYISSAPYNGIIVTAASPHIPQPLIDQLDHGAINPDRDRTLHGQVEQLADQGAAQAGQFLTNQRAAYHAYAHHPCCVEK